MLRPSRTFLTLLILGMVLGMLFIGLYPFNYFTPNKVAASEDGPGIRFERFSAITASEETSWPWDGYPGTPFTMELVLEPGRTYYRGVPHILTLCNGLDREVAYFGQWKDSLILRLMEPGFRRESIAKEVGFGGILISGEEIFLTLVFSGVSAQAYVNGEHFRNIDSMDLIPRMKDHPVRGVVLGNSSTGDSPWTGRILHLSVHEGALDWQAVQDRYRSWREGSLRGMPESGKESIRYTFEIPAKGIIRNQVSNRWNLSVPERLVPLRRPLLVVPNNRFLNDRSFFKDALINLTGFIPLGLVLAMFFADKTGIKYTKKGIFFTAIVGGSLSLFIEVNQIFLVTRDSSLIDLVLNTLGAGLGGGVHLLLTRRHSDTGINPPVIPKITRPA